MFSVAITLISLIRVGLNVSPWTSWSPRTFWALGWFCQWMGMSPCTLTFRLCSYNMTQSQVTLMAQLRSDQYPILVCTKLVEPFQAQLGSLYTVLGELEHQKGKPWPHSLLGAWAWLLTQHGSLIGVNIPSRSVGTQGPSQWTIEKAGREILHFWRSRMCQACGLLKSFWIYSPSLNLSYLMAIS